MPLAIPLSKDRGPLFRQVYVGIREAILSGAFRPGDRLPSTRDVAEQLGVSRTVVLLAYEQLLAEGFAFGRLGSGTYVSREISAGRRPAPPAAKARLSRFGMTAAKLAAGTASPQRSRRLLYDFAYGRNDLECFPFEMWRRILLRCARRAPASQLDYGPAGGSSELREAICTHLRRSRAVACDPSQVIIVNGSQQALDLVVRIFIEPGDPVALEDPGYQGTRAVLHAAGARVHPVAVDGEGLDPARLPARARLAFVTPSHQFPTGAILSLPRRLALLQWARRSNAIVVEDDYDGEFRYGGHFLESLQGLDRGRRVVYVGTFSRTVFSSLRIGYLIAPKSLVPAFAAAKWLSDRHTATLEQQALAEFISGGLYERYLRRLRRRNAVRRQVLLESVEKFLGDRVEITGDGAGTHIVLWPNDGLRAKERRLNAQAEAFSHLLDPVEAPAFGPVNSSSLQSGVLAPGKSSQKQIPALLRGKKVAPAAFQEQQIIAAAAARSVGIYGIAPHYLRRPKRAGFLLGYSRLTEREIREGIRRLAEVL